MAVIGLFLLMAMACTHRKPGGTFKWQPLDAEFDSIAEILDIRRLDMDNDISAQLDSMRAVFRRSPRQDALRGRMAYWEAFGRFWQQHDVDSALEWLARAEAFTDSSQMPYDWARIKLSGEIDPDMDLYSRYCSIVSCRRVFESSGDSVYMALCDNELGNIMALIGNYSMAYEYMELALGGFRSMGFGNVVPRLKMNMAALLSDMGYMERADSVIDEVLRDSSMYVNPSLENLVYMNKFLINKDTAYLRKAYEIVSARPYALRFHISESVELGKMFLVKNRLDSAGKYIGFAYDHIDDEPLMEERSEIALLHLMYLLRSNRCDGAAAVLDSCMAILDSLGRQTADEQIMNAETRRKIESVRLRETRRQERNRMLIWVVALVSVIVVLAGGAGVLMYKNKLLREKREVESRLQRSRESMAAMRLRQDTARNLLEKLHKDLDDASDCSEKHHDAVNWVRKQIKMYQARVAEWDTMLESFDQIHPDFEARMLKAYPSLTKKQIEFAGYIALGLTTKQIAELLKIDAASVNTNRYRLRTKMGLDRNQSLEEAVAGVVR